MKTELLKELQTVTEKLTEMISSRNEDDLNKIPFKDSWTAAQVADHLLKSYSAVEVLKGPVKETERAPDEKEGMIKDTFLNFNSKLKSPEDIVPAEGIIDKKQLLTALNEKIKQLIDVIKTQDLSKTCTSHVLPVFGEFTRLEWLYLILFHTQRHLHQLKNIFASLDKP